MEQDRGFTADLLQALRQTLSDTFSVLGASDVDYAALLAKVASQLIVSAILISLFIGAYLIMRWLMQMILRRLKLTEAIYSPLLLELRYVFFLLTALAIMAQLGIKPDVLSAAAKARLPPANKA
ncbi:MAG TPA: hypothetical protein VLN90_04020 [Thioalkalivibrio sp.]|nr:hypothetical protein [Thioalkalivibrio sp.]